jgi:hypothetical protein
MTFARPGDTGGVRMVTPDGRWRVEQIRVIRGGCTLTRLRVSTFGGVFVAEVADVDQLAALGVQVGSARWAVLPLLRGALRYAE